LGKKKPCLGGRARGKYMKVGVLYYWSR